MKRKSKLVRHTKMPTCVADDPDFCRVLDGSGYVDVTACATNSPSAPVTVAGAVKIETDAEKIARLETKVKALEADVKILRRIFTAPKRGKA